MGDKQEGQQQSEELSAGDLRRMLKEEQDKNKEHLAKITAFEQDRQLRDAGLGHLSDRQRRTILRELAEDNQEFSGEAALSVASELGFSTTPPSAKPQEPTSNGDGGDGQQHDDGQAEDALTVLGQMQQARQAAGSNQVSADFEGEMKKADSKDELRDIIRTKGPRHGVIHEWDVP